MRHTGMEVARTLRLTSLLIFGVVLTLAACGNQTAPAGPADPSDAATTSAELLEGRTFLSTSISGHELVDGSQVRMTFDGGSVSVQAGCNTMFGPYAVEQDSLRVTHLAGTEMGCPEELMSQDQWLGEFLESGPGFVLRGDDLTLTSGDVELVLADREIADPDLSFDDTTWQLESSIRGDAVSNTVGMEQATLRFDQAEGRLLVDTGCNQGSAPYERDGDRVTVGPLVLTKMACEPQAMDIEQLVVEALDQQTLTMSIVGGQLTLSGEDGDGLGLRAQA